MCDATAADKPAGDVVGTQLTEFSHAHQTGGVSAVAPASLPAATAALRLAASALLQILQVSCSRSSSLKHLLAGEGAACQLHAGIDAAGIAGLLAARPKSGSKVSPRTHCMHVISAGGCGGSRHA